MGLRVVWSRLWSQWLWGGAGSCKANLIHPNRKQMLHPHNDCCLSYRSMSALWLRARKMQVWWGPSRNRSRSIALGTLVRFEGHASGFTHLVKHELRNNASKSSLYFIPGKHVPWGSVAWVWKHNHNLDLTFHQKHVGSATLDHPSFNMTALNSIAYFLVVSFLIVIRANIYGVLSVSSTGLRLLHMLFFTKASWGLLSLSFYKRKCDK